MVSLICIYMSGDEKCLFYPIAETPTVPLPRHHKTASQDVSFSNDKTQTVTITSK